MAAVASALAAAPPRAAAQPPAPELPLVPLAPMASGGGDGMSPSAPCGRAPAAPRPAGSARGRPRGYLGLRLSELSDVRWTDEGRLVRYCAYPVVVSVEPASPAERAGLLGGDTILAYGGRDLVRDGPIPLDRVLIAGETVRVRLRRDGRTLTRPVVVGERPTVGVWAFGTTTRTTPPAPGWPPAVWPHGTPPERELLERAWRLGVVPRDSARGPARAGGRDGVAGGGDRSVRVRVSTREQHEAEVPGRATGGAAADRIVLDAFGREGAARDMMEHARASEAPLITYLRALPAVTEAAWSDGPAALAGARVLALDPDLRDAVAGAPARGVFVLQVLPGTPAAEAGLRAGDVIVSAGGKPVHSPAALQRALAARASASRALAAQRAERTAAGRPLLDAPEARAVALRVTRGGSTREVVLRW
jgi:hypothetical protein